MAPQTDLGQENPVEKGLANDTEVPTISRA
jgi:hypothetical protein